LGAVEVERQRKYDGKAKTRTPSFLPAVGLIPVDSRQQREML